jgi:hypothetical protein
MLTENSKPKKNHNSDPTILSNLPLHNGRFFYLRDLILFEQIILLKPICIFYFSLKDEFIYSRSTIVSEKNFPRRQKKSSDSLNEN